MKKKNVAETYKTDVKYNKSLVFFHQNHLCYVRCKYCCQFPEIVKLSSSNRKPPPIATASGTRFREQIVTDHHLNKEMRKNCHEAYQQSLMMPMEKLTKTPMGKFINQANIALANHIGSLLLHVFGGVEKIDDIGKFIPCSVCDRDCCNKFRF